MDKVAPPSGDSALDNQANTKRSEEHTSELQSQSNLVCRLLLEKKKRSQTNSWTRGRRFCSSPMRGARCTESLATTGWRPSSSSAPAPPTPCVTGCRDYYARRETDVQHIGRSTVRSARRGRGRLPLHSYTAAIE